MKMHWIDWHMNESMSLPLLVISTEKKRARTISCTSFTRSELAIPVSLRVFYAFRDARLPNTKKSLVYDNFYVYSISATRFFFFSLSCRLLLGKYDGKLFLVKLLNGDFMRQEFMGCCTRSRSRPPASKWIYFFGGHVCEWCWALVFFSSSLQIYSEPKIKYFLSKRNCVKMITLHLCTNVYKRLKTNSKMLCHRNFHIFHLCLDSQYPSRRPQRNERRNQKKKNKLWFSITNVGCTKSRQRSKTIRACYYWCVTTNSNKWAGKPSMSQQIAAKKAPSFRRREEKNHIALFTITMRFVTTSALIFFLSSKWQRQ